MNGKIVSVFFLGFVATLVLTKGRCDEQSKPTPADNAQVTSSEKSVPTDRASAVFSGGCFWCVESDFENAPGVVEVISGYSGGRTKNPTYKNYSEGGHREAIFIIYDPTKVTYAGLVEFLLKHIDPTDRTGSFMDKGLHYSSAIYYATPEEKSEAQRVAKAIDDLKVLRGKVVVPILPRQTFWRAEDYHQDYHDKSAAHYGAYRASCGRDNFVQKLWGSAANQLTIPGAFPDAAQIEKIKSQGESPNLKHAAEAQAPWINFKKPSDKELRKKLSSIQFEVTQRKGTEVAFRNPFFNHHEEGLYVDIVSGEPLFSSIDKFESGTGWPSFVKPLVPKYIIEREDRSELPVRTEVRSRLGDSHLGHVFTDGPADRGGMRYCINSASLRFVPKRKLESEGYGEFLELFDGLNTKKASK